MNILLEYCMPFVRNGGRFLAMKGAAEEEPYENALRELKGEVESEDRFTLPQSEFTRRIVCVKKNGFLVDPLSAQRRDSAEETVVIGRKAVKCGREASRGSKERPGPEGVETFIFR